MVHLNTHQLYDALDRQRRRRRLSKQEVSRELGLHPSVLSDWQWGDTMPSGTSLVRVVGWLDIDLRDYLARDEEQEVEA